MASTTALYMPVSTTSSKNNNKNDNNNNNDNDGNEHSNGDNNHNDEYNEYNNDDEGNNNNNNDNHKSAKSRGAKPWPSSFGSMTVEGADAEMRGSGPANARKVNTTLYPFGYVLEHSTYGVRFRCSIVYDGGQEQQEQNNNNN